VPLVTMQLLWKPTVYRDISPQTFCDCTSCLVLGRNCPSLFHEMVGDNQYVFSIDVVWFLQQKVHADQLQAYWFEC